MNKNECLNLIDGSFSSEEASEILLNIFLTKLQFNEINNFKWQEKFGINNERAKTRIAALKIEIEKLKQTLVYAKQKNKQLEITSEIRIKILD